MEEENIIIIIFIKICFRNYAICDNFTNASICVNFILEASVKKTYMGILDFSAGSDGMASKIIVIMMRVSSEFPCQDDNGRYKCGVAHDTHN